MPDWVAHVLIALGAVLVAPPALLGLAWLAVCHGDGGTGWTRNAEALTAPRSNPKRIAELEAWHLDWEHDHDEGVEHEPDRCPRCRYAQPLHLGCGMSWRHEP